MYVKIWRETNENTDRKKYQSFPVLTPCHIIMIPNLQNSIFSNGKNTRTNCNYKFKWKIHNINTIINIIILEKIKIIIIKKYHLS